MATKLKGSGRNTARLKRKIRVRKHVQGTESRPRLCVFRSLKYTYAQLISDDTNKVLVSATTKQLDTDGASRSNKDAAKKLGSKIAELAKGKDIKEVVFDRNGYVYHGRVAAVAEGAREGGLQF